MMAVSQCSALLDVRYNLVWASLRVLAGLSLHSRVCYERFEAILRQHT
jgi:hypothetical protein